MSRRAITGHRLAATLCICAALLLLGSWHAAAEDTPDQQRALLTLVVNEVNQGEVFVVVRASDALVDVDVLEHAGLRNLAGRRETMEGRTFVSLASLAPALTFKLDERALVLAITANAAHLSGTTVDLLRQRPDYTFSRTTSAFLNYGANWSRGTGTSGALESGVSLGPALLQNTVSWDPSNKTLRGLSNLVVDQVGQMRRWTFGDAIVSARLFGSGLVLGGVHVARDYGLDPYFIQFPSFGMSGTTVTPSTVEVYVNGRLVSREQVAPGTFTLQNVPLNTGTNSTRVVVRDAFGREQTMSAPYYLTTTVLARGLHDYDYAVGYPRSGAAFSNWNYGRLSAIARHRYGFTDRLTAGVVAEADALTQAAGPTLNCRLGVGEIELAASGSASQGRRGAAAAAGYAVLGRLVSFSMRLRSMTADYSTLTVFRPEDRVRFEVSGQVGTQFGHWVTLSVQQAQAETYAGGTRAQTSANATIGVGRGLSLFVNASYSRDAARRGTDVYAGLSVPLAARTSASVWAHGGSGGSGTSADIQRALPAGDGYGYRGRAALGGDSQAEMILEAQNRYGRYEAGSEVMNGAQTPHAAVNGGLVAIGGRVMATRPVVDSFALVRVPDVSGVRTFLNNQEIGRTNRNGDLLMANLLPYYANRIAIADQDVPIERSIDAVERAVAPPFRGGALVTFAASERRSVSGTLALSVGGQSVVPSLGELSVSAGNRSLQSPIGRNGEFYLEGLPAGRHPAVVVFGQTTCQFELTVPSSDLNAQRLGVVRCVVPEAK